MTTQSHTRRRIEAFHPAIIGATTRGLHDTAQPLTVLQGVLELALTRAQTIADYRQGLECALEQAERVASDLEYVRQLVRLQQPANDVRTFKLFDVATRVLDELRGIFAAANAEVVLSRPPGSYGEVRASQSRIQKAFLLLFSSLLPVLRKGSRVSVRIETQRHKVTMRLEVGDGVHEMALQSDEAGPTGFELARIIVASSAGEMIFTRSPLAVSISLPRAEASDHELRARKKGNSLHV